MEHWCIGAKHLNRLSLFLIRGLPQSTATSDKPTDGDTSPGVNFNGTACVQNPITHYVYINIKERESEYNVDIDCRLTTALAELL